DDRATRPQVPAPLRLGDHGNGDAVLDAAARVHRLDFDVNGDAQALSELAKADERRPADRLQDIVVHGRLPGLACPPIPAFFRSRNGPASRVCRPANWHAACTLIRVHRAASARNSGGAQWLTTSIAR